MTDKPDKKLVAVVKPPKPVAQMTAAERRVFAEALANATVPHLMPPEAKGDAGA